MVDTYTPALKAKVLQGMGLAALSDAAPLDHVITDAEVVSMTALLADISAANPEFEPIATRLTQIANQLSGLSLNEAMEYVLAIDPLN